MQFLQGVQCNWIIHSDSDISDNISWSDSESSLTDSELKYNNVSAEQVSPDFHRVSTPAMQNQLIKPVLPQTPQNDDFEDLIKYHANTSEFKPFRAY